MITRTKTAAEIENLIELSHSLSISSDDIIISVTDSKYTELIEALGGQRIDIENDVKNTTVA